MTESTYQSWLASLKVGDRVIVRWKNGHRDLLEITEMGGATTPLLKIGGMWFASSRGTASDGHGGIEAQIEFHGSQNDARILHWHLSKVLMDKNTRILSLPTLQAIKKLIEKD